MASGLVAAAASSRCCASQHKSSQLHQTAQDSALDDIELNFQPESLTTGKDESTWAWSIVSQSWRLNYRATAQVGK